MFVSKGLEWNNGHRGDSLCVALLLALVPLQKYPIYFKIFQWKFQNEKKKIASIILEDIRIWREGTHLVTAPKLNDHKNLFGKEHWRAVDILKHC